MKKNHIPTPVSQLPPSMENNFFVKMILDAINNNESIANLMEQLEKDMDNWGPEKFFSFFQATEYLLSKETPTIFHKNFIVSQRFALRKILDKLKESLEPKIKKKNKALPESRIIRINEIFNFFKKIIKDRVSELEEIRLKYPNNQARQAQFDNIRKEYEIDLSLINKLQTKL